ncbi:MAG: LAGLIDADG family homing endonuclease [Nanoarchaeota archaeon]
MNIHQEKIIENLKNLEKELGRRPVKRDNATLYFLSRKHFGTWNKMMSTAGYKCKSIQKPTTPKEITRELSYFLGLVSTDGHMQVKKEKGQYRLMVYTSEKEEVDLILKLILLLFNYKASIRLRKTGFKNSRPNYEIYMSSKDVTTFMKSLEIPSGAKSENIRLPTIFFRKEAYIWDYLRGVFDGDGSIIFSGHNHIFKISSGSIGFLKDLHKILIENGFNNFKIWKDKGNVWNLRNNTKRDIVDLHNQIYKNASFFYPRKKLKWDSQYI